MTDPVRLHDIAPRLAKARDQRIVEIRRQQSIDRVTAEFQRMSEAMRQWEKLGASVASAVYRMNEAFAKACRLPR